MGVRTSNQWKPGGNTRIIYEKPVTQEMGCAYGGEEQAVCGTKTAHHSSPDDVRPPLRVQWAPGRGRHSRY